MTPPTSGTGATAARSRAPNLRELARRRQEPGGTRRASRRGRRLDWRRIVTLLLRKPL